ncbi:protein SDE2 homolog [Acanthaster planci]|uniref:Protein SDE2 homolog n=1 Tax=Acanthaster planci TaxID=133434 RepID=A0A8B7YKF5_ACAPL|nr:protein SDE2 homolog [Acanthaster planci]
MSVFVRTFSGRTLCLQSHASCYNGENLTQKIGELEGIPIHLLSLYHHGKKVGSSDLIQAGDCYQALLCLQGGKGGFGSMLRMIGAQIDKTTNHDACRDLSGRRMRDVNNEKKLSDWITKKAEMERERQEKRREKLERLRQEPKHIFVDPSYDKQKQEVIENLDEAITQGIQAAATLSEGASSSGVKTVKRKAEASVRSKKRSKTLWMGLEERSDSDSDSSDGEDMIKITSVISESNTSSESPSTSDNSPSVSRNSPSSNVTDPGQDSEPEIKPIVAKTGGTEGNEEDLKAIREDNGKCEDANSLLNMLPAPSNSENRNSDESIKDEKDEEEQPFDLDKFSSAAELESVGLDTLKSALMVRGMKCGGTLQQRAERLFSVKGISLDQIDPSLLAKPSKGKKGK